MGGAIYGNSPLKNAGQALLRGGALRRMAQGSVSSYARRSDPGGLCSVPDPFAGGVGYPAVRGYRYEGHPAAGTAGKDGFNLADFGKELLTGFVAGGLSSAAFYGAGKAVEAVKGSVRGVGKGDIYSVGDATFMDSDENFLKYIQNVDGYNGQGIRLLSCNMGALDNGFAQNLANQLNVKVYASTNYLWAERNGNYFVAGMRNQGGPNMSKLGIFRVFIPGGNQ